MNATLIRRERLIEFTFSITFKSGGTQTLVIKAWNYADAEARIARNYPGAALNWII